MKNTISILFLVVIILGSIGCKKDPEPEPFKVEILGNSIDSTFYYKAMVTTQFKNPNWSFADKLGHCWSTSHNPTIDNDKTSYGYSFNLYHATSPMEDLLPNTIYYVRFYYTKNEVTTYTEEFNLTTVNTRAPNIVTDFVIVPTLSIATSGGNNDDGGLEVISRGICWSSSTATPTLENNLGYTSQESGTGFFFSEIEDLDVNNTYYVCAYAINSKGTSYGQVEEFVFADPLIELLPVEGGTFQMGSEDGEDYEKPIHTVTLSNFEMGKYEITKEQYSVFLNDINCNNNGTYDDPEFGLVSYMSVNWSTSMIRFKDSVFYPEDGYAEHPATGLSWYGAKAFVRWAHGRLPTEAEWEFAARGGNYTNQFIYSGGNYLDDFGWYEANSTQSDYSFPVGLKLPNELGLYDMSGNVFEWCNDWFGYNYYSVSPEVNPIGPEDGTYRVLRGGSIRGSSNGCRVAFRTGSESYIQSGYRGFRMVK